MCSLSKFAVLFACFLPRQLFTSHCIHFSSGASWELLRTELNNRTKNWNWFHSELVTEPPHRPHRKHLRLYCCVLSHHYVATAATLRFASRRIHWCFLTQQRQANTHSSAVAWVITCLLSRCLAMLWPSTLLYCTVQQICNVLSFQSEVLLAPAQTPSCYDVTCWLSLTTYLCNNSYSFSGSRLHIPKY
jgi:hypothetical protein